MIWEWQSSHVILCFIQYPSRSGCRAKIVHLRPAYPRLLWIITEELADIFDIIKFFFVLFPFSICLIVGVPGSHGMIGIVKLKGMPRTMFWPTLSSVGEKLPDCMMTSCLILIGVKILWVPRIELRLVGIQHFSCIAISTQKLGMFRWDSKSPSVHHLIPLYLICQVFIVPAIRVIL